LQTKRVPLRETAPPRGGRARRKLFVEGRARRKLFVEGRVRRTPSAGVRRGRVFYWSYPGSHCFAGLFEPCVINLLRYSGLLVFYWYYWVADEPWQAASKLPSPRAVPVAPDPLVVAKELHGGCIFATGVQLDACCLSFTSFRWVRASAPTSCSPRASGESEIRSEGLATSPVNVILYFLTCCDVAPSGSNGCARAHPVGVAPEPLSESEIRSKGSSCVSVFHLRIFEVHVLFP
jgi:hypothetical protein